MKVVLKFHVVKVKSGIKCNHDKCYRGETESVKGHNNVFVLSVLYISNVVDTESSHELHYPFISEISLSLEKGFNESINLP